MEFISVFLLAIEAIKVENLNFVKSKIEAFHLKVNPTIKIVDEMPKDLPFFEKFAIELMLIGTYLFGLLCLLAVNYLSKYDFMKFPEGLLSKAVFIVLLMIVPFFIGSLTYITFVWFLNVVIRFLVWLETSTHSGVVGILGFSIFAFQYIGRRVIE